MSPVQSFARAKSVNMFLEGEFGVTPTIIRIFSLEVDQFGVTLISTSLLPASLK